MRPLSEAPFDACRSIASAISRAEFGADNVGIRAALLLDLFWKSRRIDDQAKAIVLAQGMYELLPDPLRRTLDAWTAEIGNLQNLPAWTKERRDIAIVTVIKQELDAVLRAIDVEPDMPRTVGGVDYWLGRVARRQRPALTVVVTRLGKPRNVPMAMRVQNLLTYFDVGLLVGVGIAAGISEKMDLGDVAIADRIYDYEHVRSELHGYEVVEKPRPLIVEVPTQVAQDLDLFEADWLGNVFGGLVAREDVVRSPGGGGWRKPTARRGTIAAGERLLADGGLAAMRDKLDSRIIAGDQEDSGLAQAAEAARVPWCVFRGISDHGDMRKPSKDDWHFAASLAAASAAVAFLRFAYRPSTDQPF